MGRVPAGKSYPDQAACATSSRLHSQPVRTSKRSRRCWTATDWDSRASTTHTCATSSVPGDVQVSTTRRMCDCGTVLASRGNPEVQRSPTEREMRKLRAKGWGKARIKRWLVEKTLAADRALRARDREAESGAPELDRWIGVISKVLSMGYASRFGLLVHWYSGGMESERLQLGPTQSMPLSELSATTLLEMREDSLLEVRGDH